MIRKLDLPLMLLATAGFLAPLIGGQVAFDVTSLPQGADVWMTAIKGAPEAATLSHSILALFVAASLVIMLLQRKIMQVPNTVVGALVMALLALILVTVGYSSFRGVSIPAALEWMTYGFAFYAVVAATGRQKGPMVLLGSIFAGCVVVAWLGIHEYGDMKADVPSWRILGTWVGPNALAAMLVVGMFLGLGIAVNTKRLVSGAAVLGCVVIGLALFLTQSKGVVAALIVCLILFAVLLVRWLPRKDIGRTLGVVGGTLAIVLVMCLAISVMPKIPPPGAKDSAASLDHSPGERFVNVAASSEQSVGFRKLLWQSAAKLIALDPIGIGIGSFQYESSRPGLTTQTHFAHNTYLQLGAEASAAAPLILLAAFALWVRLLLRGGAKLQAPQNVLRASVLAACVAIVGHSLVDSDFSYYGIGLVMFMLLGVGLLLSSDAVAPEFMPSLLRRTAAIGVASITILLMYFGYAEASRAQAKGYMEVSTLNDAQNRLESLRSMAPWDAEVWELSALVTQDPNTRLAYARKAVSLGPSTKNLRALAKICAMTGLFGDALGALQRSLDLDPNNMETLWLMADIDHQMGEADKERKALEDLVRVESTPYFQIRSLPEIIPTTTFSARIRLAGMTSDNAEKVRLLQPAIDGFKQYRTYTTPNIIRAAHDPGGPMPFGGEDLPAAEKKLSTASEAAKSLADAYRALGEPVKAAAALADAGELGKPLDLPSAK